MDRLLTWLSYAVINIIIAYIHNEFRKDNTKIQHGWWAVGYGAICALLYFPFRELWICVSVLLLHLSIFPVAFNILSGVPVFNLSKTTTSIIDKTMVSIGLKSTAIVNIISFAASVFMILL